MLEFQSQPIDNVTTRVKYKPSADGSFYTGPFANLVEDGTGIHKIVLSNRQSEEFAGKLQLHKNVFDNVNATPLQHKLNNLFARVDVLSKKFSYNELVLLHANQTLDHEKAHLRINASIFINELNHALALLLESDEMETSSADIKTFYFNCVIIEWFTNVLVAQHCDSVIMLRLITILLREGIFESASISGLFWSLTHNLGVNNEHANAVIAFLMGDINIFEKIQRLKYTPQGSVAFEKAWLKKYESFVNNPQAFLRNMITPELVIGLFNKQVIYARETRRIVYSNRRKLSRKHQAYLGAIPPLPGLIK